MIRRAIGLILVLLGLTGLAICYVGARAGRDLVDTVGTKTDEFLSSANATLETVEDTLEQSRQTVLSVNESIDQVRTTTANLSLAIDDTQPTLDQLAQLVGEDIPGTVIDVQNAIPNIAQTAKVIDDTLRLLSRLRVEQTVPIINYEISFGLGVEYDPEIPFDQAVEEVGLGLEPIATASGNMEGELRTAKANMLILSQDLDGLTESLDALNEEVRSFRPLLDEYSTLVEDMQDSIVDTRTRLTEQSSAAKRLIVLAAVWFSLFQLLPLYFGLELLMGSKMARPEELHPYSIGASPALDSGSKAQSERDPDDTLAAAPDTQSAVDANEPDTS